MLPPARESSAASLSLIAVHKLAQVASRHAPKALPVASRIKVARASSPVALVPSTPRVPALPVQAREVPAVQEAPAAVPASVRAPDSAPHAPAASVPLRVAHRQ